MEQKFNEFRESDNITETWNRVNLKILSVTCAFTDEETKVWGTSAWLSSHKR